MNERWSTGCDPSSLVPVAQLRGIYEVREGIADRSGRSHVAAMCRSLLDALEAVEVTEVILTADEFPEGIEMTLAEPTSGFHLYSVCFCSCLVPESEQVP